MAQYLNGWRPAPRPSRTAPEVDVGGLAHYLRQRMRGEVRFDSRPRALYSTAAANYRQIPIGGVVPRDAADVELAIEGCRTFSAPIVFRGGGTGLAGQTVNVAVLIDTSKYM